MWNLILETWTPTISPHTPQVLILKPIYGLIRVRFVPNSEPTRPDWVVRISTNNRLERLIGSGWLELQRMLDGSVGVEDLKNGENPARKRWKTAKIKWENFEKQLKSSQISLDPVRSRPFSARSQLDLAQSCRI